MYNELQFEGASCKTLFEFSSFFFSRVYMRNKQMISRTSPPLVDISLSREADWIVRDCCPIQPESRAETLLPSILLPSVPFVILSPPVRPRSNDDCILGVKRGIRSRFKILYQLAGTLQTGGIWFIEALSWFYVGKFPGDVCNRSDEYFGLRIQKNFAHERTKIRESFLNINFS